MLNPVMSTILLIGLFFVGGYVGSVISGVLVKKSTVTKLIQLTSILL